MASLSVLLAANYLCEEYKGGNQNLEPTNLHLIHSI